MKGRAEKEIIGVTDTMEKILIQVDNEGIEITDKTNDSLVGWLYMYWREWEETEKFVKEVKNRNE